MASRERGIAKKNSSVQINLISDILEVYWNKA